jgi:hypothetical protein
VQPAAQPEFPLFQRRKSRRASHWTVSHNGSQRPVAYQYEPAAYSSDIFHFEMSLTRSEKNERYTHICRMLRIVWILYTEVRVADRDDPTRRKFLATYRTSSHGSDVGNPARRASVT